MENAQRVGFATPPLRNQSHNSRDRRRTRSREKEPEVLAPRCYATRLPVPISRGVVRYLPMQKLEWIEAANQYVRVHAGGRSYLLRDSLSHVEALLPPTQFLRVHRSAIVRLAQVSELRAESHTHRWLVLANGQRIPVSHRHWRKLQAAMLYPQ